MRDLKLTMFQVTKAHAGDYTCTPYNTHGTSGTSGVMQVHVRDPPSIKLRPEDEYIRTVGEKVTFPCSASGTPTHLQSPGGDRRDCPCLRRDTRPTRVL